MTRHSHRPTNGLSLQTQRLWDASFEAKLYTKPSSKLICLYAFFAFTPSCYQSSTWANTSGYDTTSKLIDNHAFTVEIMLSTIPGSDHWLGIAWLLAGRGDCYFHPTHDSVIPRMLRFPGAYYYYRSSPSWSMIPNLVDEEFNDSAFEHSDQTLLLREGWYSIPVEAKGRVTRLHPSIDQNISFIDQDQGILHYCKALPISVRLNFGIWMELSAFGRRFHDWWSRREEITTCAGKIWCISSLTLLEFSVSHALRLDSLSIQHPWQDVFES